MSKFNLLLIQFSESRFIEKLISQHINTKLTSTDEHFDHYLKH